MLAHDNSGISKELRRTILIVIAVLGAAVAIQAQTDPGVRAGASGAGRSLDGLTTQEQKFFRVGVDVFGEVDSVRGTVPGAAGKGLGPRFNLDSCGGCHAQPALGGTSPLTNPQVAMATKAGAHNTVPDFITLSGPVRVARFKYVDPPLNTIRDGGVHALFTISGRTDAVGCNIVQPDFRAAAASNNLIFRIPTPTFGAGLIETILDSTIISNKNADATAKAALGISGHENREGNAGTITRFGWKAQNKSLTIFSGEAYNVEQGVTNEVFPNERDETPQCLFNGTPEDHTNFGQAEPRKIPSDVVHMVEFMRFLAAPAAACGPAPLPACSTSIANGQTLFNKVGCALCHTPSLPTGPSTTLALSHQPADLFSDLLVHQMGPGLADDVVPGNAGPGEFRTAPLWGLGQRTYFMHDGRTNDLLVAIQAHASLTDGVFPDSEANATIANFDKLTPAEKQDILNFLRSR
jgi:CxxC motif-containing protein (DUF1111 family)